MTSSSLLNTSCMMVVASSSQRVNATANSIGRLHVLATVIMTVHLQPPMEFAVPGRFGEVQFERVRERKLVMASIAFVEAIEVDEFYVGAGMGGSGEVGGESSGGEQEALGCRGLGDPGAAGQQVAEMVEAFQGVEVELVGLCLPDELDGLGPACSWPAPECDHVQLEGLASSAVVQLH